MKRYIRSAYDRNLGPKGYVYQLCKMLGWRTPTFIDVAAGGYAMKYDYDVVDKALDILSGVDRRADYEEKLRRRNEVWRTFRSFSEEEQEQLRDEARNQLVEECNQDIDDLKAAAAQLGIKILRPSVKPLWGKVRFYAVVPRKEA